MLRNIHLTDLMGLCGNKVHGLHKGAVFPTIKNI
jgi:hypothetical protein